jgi:hypothetical protein
MMPIVWFYVALVLVLWALLAYVEVKRRGRRKVRGCLELEIISADKLWSMMVIDPQLVVIELQPGAAANPESNSPLVQGAVQVPVSQLMTYLQSVSPRQSFAFYSPEPGAVSWDEVDCAVCRAGLRKGYVLGGEVALWRKSRLPLQAAGKAHFAAG